MKDNKKTTLGVIIGNRSFFPGHLCKDARERILKVIQEEDLDVVILDEESTEYGAVSTLDDAKKCGRLFAAHRHEIDGILVTLPKFGEEKMSAHTIR